jgi:hypothetical protein
MLRFNEYSDYVSDGFSIKIWTVETGVGKYRAYWNVNKSIGGEGDEQGYATEPDAHIAAMRFAKQRIAAMLECMPIDEWRKLGIF